MSLANENIKAHRNGIFKFSWVSLELLTCNAQRMCLQSQMLEWHLVAMMASRNILK